MTIVENSKTEVGRFERNFQITSSVGSLNFLVEYTAFVKGFMEQKGKVSKPHKLHFIDTRRCKFIISGSIERQLYVISPNGDLDEFGQEENVKVDDFFLRFSSNTTGFSSFESALFEIGHRIAGLGSFHTKCEDYRKGFRKDRLSAISLMQQALARLQLEVADDPTILDKLDSSTGILERIRRYSQTGASFVNVDVSADAVLIWSDDNWIVDVSNFDDFPELV
jgi:hypothetical protein